MTLPVPPPSWWLSVLPQIKGHPTLLGQRCRIIVGATLAVPGKLALAPDFWYNRPSPNAQTHRASDAR